MKKPRLISATLVASFVGFLVLSWWLLFRDERALTAIGTFFPSLTDLLFFIRQWLLVRGLNTIPTVLFGAVALMSTVAYLLSLKSSIDIKTTVFFAIVFQVITFFSYPILSTDIFSYIFSDRVYTEYGQNIWQVTPENFSQDPFEQLADWKDQTKVYGAVNQILYLPASYIGGENLILTIALYKVVAVVFSLATLWLLTKMTAHLPQKDSTRMLRLLFWNPLFVLEIAGSGHNDILMIFFFLLALSMYWKKMWVWAGIALAVSVQIKMITGVFLIFAGLQLLREKKYRALLLFITSFAIVNLLAFWYMQVSPFEFLGRVFANTSVYWQSLPALIHRFWPGEKALFSFLLLVLVGWLSFTHWKQKYAPVFTTTVFLLAYLLFFSAAYWNWYVLWILCMVPFIKAQWLQVMIVSFSITSLFAYPLLWTSQRFGYNHNAWAFVYYLWIFVVPILMGWLAKKKSKVLVV